MASRRARSPARRRLQPTVGGDRPVQTGLFDQTLAASASQPRSRRERCRRRPRDIDQSVAAAAPHGAGRLDRPRSRRLLRAGRDRSCRSSVGLLPLAVMGTEGWLLAIIAAVLGYLVPDVVLTRATRRHQKAIQNGLPDAHRPDCRLRRGRLQPRPGHHAHERRARVRAARVRARSCARSPTKFAPASRDSKRFKVWPSAPRSRTCARW